MQRNLLTAAILTLVCIFCTGQAQAAMDHQQGRYAYVTNEDDNNLMVVDLQTDKVVKTLDTGKIPHALVFTGDGKGYVSNRGDKTLTVIDGDSFTVIHTLSLPATSMQIALSPDGKILAVGYKDALLITLIDTANDRILASVPIGRDREGEKAVRIKHPFWSADGRFVYAGDEINQTVVKIDAKTFQIAATIPVHATTHHFVADPTGEYLYAVHGKGENGALMITVLNAASDRIVKTIAIPMTQGEKAKGHHGEFSPDGKSFYFCNEGGRTLAVIDPATMTLIKTLQVGEGAGHPVFTRDGKRAFVICHADNVVSVIDTTSQKVIRNIKVGEGKKEGHSGYMTPDGFFYMLNAAASTLVRIDTASMTVKSQIKVGRTPMVFAVR
ncbi:MAG: cytochrome D1 domain-containing protein [Deltaproteobacteria bacterium]